jgi:hypothetical protein
MTGAADPPRSRRLLRLIAIERVVRGLVLLGAGVYLLFHVNRDFGRLRRRAMRDDRAGHERPFLHRIVAYLHHLHASELRVLRSSRSRIPSSSSLRGRAMARSTLGGVSDSDRDVAPASWELYELVHRPSVWKAAGVAVNIAIVVYLARLSTANQLVPRGRRSGSTDQ